MVHCVEGLATHIEALLRVPPSFAIAIGDSAVARSIVSIPIPSYDLLEPPMDNQEPMNEQEWKRPENWTGWLGTYRSARDTRLWVPKRNPARGWTLNFAHRAAWWSLVGLFTVPLGFVVLFLLSRLSL